MVLPFYMQTKTKIQITVEIVSKSSTQVKMQTKKIVKPSQKGVDSFLFRTAEFLVQDKIPLFTSKNLPVDLHFTAHLTAP